MSISDFYKKAAEILGKRGIAIEFIYTIQGHLKVSLQSGRHLVGVAIQRDQVKPQIVKAAVQQTLQELSLQMAALNQEVACPGS